MDDPERPQRYCSRGAMHESYFQLVWRRFRRSQVAIVGALMVLTMIILAIFADFFSPSPLKSST